MQLYLLSFEKEFYFINRVYKILIPNPYKINIDLPKVSCVFLELDPLLEIADEQLKIKSISKHWLLSAQLFY